MRLIPALVRLYARFVLRRPALAGRIQFYVPDLPTFLANGLNELYYLAGRETGFRVTSAVMELTSSCNMDCLLCARHEVMKRAQAPMSFETFRAVVDRNPGVRMYILVGWGEMMLNPDFFAMTAYLKERGKIIALTTNASLFTEANVERILESGITFITVSMDGMDRVYESLRQYPFERIEANVVRLHRRIQETGKAIHVEINAIATPEVLAQAAAFRERMGRWVDEIRFSSYVEYNRLLPTNRKKPCRELWRGMITVLQDGRAVPCCMDYNASLVLGDARETPLQELWNNRTARGIRRSHRKGLFLKRCADCYEEVPPDESGLQRRFD